MNDNSNQFGSQRKIIDTNTTQYQPYDFAGPTLEGVFQLDLSYNQNTGHGAYMIRMEAGTITTKHIHTCLLYTSPSPRDATLSRMPSSA